MTDLLTLGEVLIAGGFVLLAVLSLLRAPRGGSSGWWAAAAFGSLGLALTASWLPDWAGIELPAATDGIQLLLVLAFPYLLLRFTATFRPLPRTLEIGAALGAVVAAAVMLFPLASALAGDGRSGDAVQLAAIFVYWAGLSGVVVVRLWRAGRGQPGVARRRIRLMSAATAALTVALIAALSGGVGRTALQSAAYGFALAGAAAFMLGFSPPRVLRLSWRQQEDQALQAATSALLRCDSVEEVAAHLLPPTVRIMGASGAAMVDRDGVVIASHGDGPSPGEALVGALDTEQAGRESAPLGKAGRRLVVWTSAYTPFFGPEELGLFRAMAAVGGLALDRCALFAEERRQRAATEQARHAAEEARAQAEQARRDADRANLAKSEFLSRMSHELRTPLNAVLGFGQLLETSRLSDEDREAVGYILKAGRHLLALINDVLDLSRIEAGTLTISLEPVHSGDLIQETLPLVKPLAAERSIRIDLDAAGCDQFVMTDRQRCRQVLLNLLSNAIKYNRDGGTVELRCSRTDDGLLRLSVTDTGPGIEPARRRRLFEPFDRLGAEASTIEGTGLGLALTKQLIERLGGTIGVDTTPGAGSTFWIELPITDAPSDPTDTQDTAISVRADTQRQLLLVEDNLANLRVVEAMLRRRPGISVLPAMQGTLALELAYQHQPHVIVLDLHLPDMSGREVLTRLKADPRTRKIPVLVASADATPGSIRQLREDGAEDYITKPLELDRFLAAVDRALGTAPNGASAAQDPGPRPAS